MNEFEPDGPDDPAAEPGIAPDAPEASPSLATEASRGMLWTSVSSLAARGIGFLSTILLTRWMSKEEYGRASAVYTIAIGLAHFSGPGLSSELIRRRERFKDAATLGTMFCTVIVLTLSAAAFAFADPITRFFDAPGAAHYLRAGLVLALVHVVLMMGDIILTRELRFGAQALLELGGSSLMVAVALGLAATGWGGFAVVLGQVVREVVLRLGSTALTGFGWLGRPRWDGPLLREMLAFGVPIYISESFDHIATNWDNLFVGKVLGMEALGAYAVAYNLAYVPIYTVTQRSSSVVLAAVARFSDDVKRRREAILRALGAILLVLFPAAALVMFTGPRVVAILFPAKWTDTVSSLVTALSLVGIGLPLQFLPDYYFQAIGRPRATTVVMAIKVVLMFGALFLFGRQNVVHAAWAVSTSFIVAGLLACALLKVVDEIPFGRVLLELAPALIGSTLLAATILGLRRVLHLDSQLVMFALEVIAGGTVYLGYLLLFHRGQVMDIVRSLVGRDDDE
ncbi:MAG: oligosaccharide flippase family protein [Deltaproteobacteria bacterium]|nr:oligosaccharide flippase family protein [Deltaproteobacteria bacterium]